MKKYKLSFISDKDLYNHVKDTVKKYSSKVNLRTFSKNLIDPIKLTFDSKVYDKDDKELIETEVLRQVDKANNNQIGYFHQNIFEYIGDGWSVPESGFDMINKKLNIFIELKNKHNTMNSSSSQRTYIKMQNEILKNPKATCMLVEVIAKKSQDRPWVISLDGERIENQKIRRVSIDNFYKLATKNKNSFRDLCQVLPTVIEDVVNEIGSYNIEDTVYKELKKVSPNILKSFYLISFKSYEGFKEFDI
jgi:hypothetical protein